MTTVVLARSVRAPFVVIGLASVGASSGFLLTAHSPFGALTGLAIATALVHGAGSLASP